MTTDVLERPAKVKAEKCPICMKRPIKDGEWCAVCAGRIRADRQSRTPPKQSPIMYMHYRGHVIEWNPSCGGTKVRATLCNLPVEKLPAKKTLDLNKWCEGYTRDTIKSFKAVILRLNHA